MPMKPKRVSFTLATQATNNIALSQTPGAAGNLSLAGALASGGVIPDLSLGYIIGIGCAGNDAGRTFTVTGIDQNGKAQTETIAGANIGTTVSTKFWRGITSIAVDAATAGAIVVGTVNTTLSASTPTYAVEIYAPYISAFIDISGTINYDIQKCGERPTAGETPNWVAGGLTGQTGDGQTTYSTPIGGVRGKINSYTNGATFAMSILTGHYN
jgi:hypothetical protein